VSQQLMTLVAEPSWPVEAMTWLMEASSELVRDGDYVAGVAGFERIAEVQPNEVFAWANLALAQRHAGWYDQCIESYRNALTHAPEDASLWNDLALVYQGAGEKDQAIFHYHRAIEVARESDGARNAVTNLYVLSLTDPGTNRRWLPALAEVVAADASRLRARILLLRALGAGER
jgi:Tfp pilus assembly protein PilF